MTALADRIRKAGDFENREAEAVRELHDAEAEYGRLLGSGHGHPAEPYPEKLRQAKARVIAAEAWVNGQRDNPDIYVHG